MPSDAITIHPRMGKRIIEAFRDQVAQLPAQERVNLGLLFAADLPADEMARLRDGLERIAAGAKVRMEYDDGRD